MGSFRYRRLFRPLIWAYLTVYRSLFRAGAWAWFRKIRDSGGMEGWKERFCTGMSSFLSSKARSSCQSKDPRSNERSNNESHALEEEISKYNNRVIERKEEVEMRKFRWQYIASQFHVVVKSFAVNIHSFWGPCLYRVHIWFDQRIKRKNRQCRWINRVILLDA
jgi:hypothetical protein